MFSFHHVALSVSDIKVSCTFYNLLGFKQVHEWEADDKSLKIVHLKNAAAFIELFCYSSPEALPAVHKDLDSDLKVIGTKHFGLKVNSLQEARKLLTEHGVEMHTEIKNGRTEVDYFFVKDPDGILVEVVEDNRGY